jgi:hypothetical protein
VILNGFQTQDGAVCGRASVDGLMSKPQGGVCIQARKRRTIRTALIAAPCSGVESSPYTYYETSVTNTMQVSALNHSEVLPDIIHESCSVALLYQTKT